jgi:hypothetical protein
VVTTEPRERDVEVEGRARLIDWLRDRDVPCPLCSYNLRGLMTPRCPECGQPLQLTVSLAEPYLKAWITTAAAACIGAGGGLFLLCIVIGEKRWPRELSAVCQLSLVMFVAMVPLGPLTLIFRRRFLRLAISAQWFVAMSMVGVCALATILFATHVR